jgi:hypothetical protein
MKTAEEVAVEVLGVWEEQNPIGEATAIIRADREEARRDAIKWVIDMINTEGLDADDTDRIYKLYIDSVNKEAP